MKTSFYSKYMKSKYLWTFFMKIKNFKVIWESKYLNKYSTLQQGTYKIGFYCYSMLICILCDVMKNKILLIKIRTYLLFDIWSKMFSSSRDALLKLSKTTPDYITWWISWLAGPLHSSMGTKIDGFVSRKMYKNYKWLLRTPLPSWSLSVYKNCHLYHSSIFPFWGPESSTIMFLYWTRVILNKHYEYEYMCVYCEFSNSFFRRFFYATMQQCYTKLITEMITPAR